jgi:hypothetical protein
LAVADGGDSVQGPQTGGLAHQPRAVVQQVREGLAVAVVQEGTGGMGA